MSRGHGSRQRAVLAALTTHAEQHLPMADFDTDGQLIVARFGFENDRGLRDVPLSFLTADDLTADPTPATIESTKRAIRKLKAADLIETCHGRNGKLGARLTPDDDTRDRWWLALEDHQHVEWLQDYYCAKLAQGRAELRHAFDEYDVDRAQRSIDFNLELARKSYAEHRESDTMLPSKQLERQRERERMTAEQKAEQSRRAGELIAGFHTAMGVGA